MQSAESAPLALLAWIARCRLAGLDDAAGAAELGLDANVFDDPRLSTLEAQLARRPDDPSPANRAARFEVAIDQLLAQGRVGEAGRMARLLGPRSFAEPEDEEPAGEALLPRDPEARAEWEAASYANWVVPPGTGRRPLASLTAEWVTPADRRRVLEELTRVEDPAERARVLDHFRRAGLDPGRDHPAFVGALDAGPPSDRPSAGAGGGPDVSGEPCSPEPVGPDPAIGMRETAAPDPAAGRDPGFHARLVLLGAEAEAYHGAGRARREAEAWARHARELGVPVRPHAGRARDPEPSSPATHAPAPCAEPPVGREPWPLCPGWHGKPRDPRTGLPLDEAKPAEPVVSSPVWPAGVGPRPPEPAPSWPWSAEDGTTAEARAAAAASTPRPAPDGKSTRPILPPEARPPGARPAHPPDSGGSEPAGDRAAERRRRRRSKRAAPTGRSPATENVSAPPPSPATPPPAPAAPVVWAPEPLGPTRMAKIRGDWPWWCS